MSQEIMKLEPEVQTQLAIASTQKRIIEEVQTDVALIIQKNRPIAESCFYSLKRGGSQIEGPSVRLAEIIASRWGNLRCDSKVVEINRIEKYVIGEATVLDMETNFAVRREVRRSISTKDGRVYSEDMINVTCNAATSIAFRNALFTVIPRAIVDELYEMARKEAVGDQKTLEQKTIDMIAAFSKMGVDEAQILELQGTENRDNITTDDLASLRGLYNRIRDGVTNIDEAFPKHESEKIEEPKDRAAQAVAALKGNQITERTLAGEAKEHGVDREMWAAWLKDVGINFEDKRTHTRERLGRLEEKIEDWRANQ